MKKDIMQTTILIRKCSDWFAALMVAAGLFAGYGVNAQSTVTEQSGDDSNPQVQQAQPGAQQLQQGAAGARGARRGGGGGARGGGARGVYRASVNATWFADNTMFWYMNSLSGGTKEFIVVEAEKGIRRPAFDHAKLASSLSRAADLQVQADRLPFSEIEFIDGNKAVQFTNANKTWKCDLNSYQCTEVKTGAGAALRAQPVMAMAEQSFDFSTEDEAPWGIPSYTLDEDAELAPDPGARRGAGGGGAGARAGGVARAGAGGGGGGGGGQFGGGGAREADSPDGKWTAFIKDNNVWLRPKEGGEEAQLSTDGVTNNAYGRIAWAPDNKAFVAWRVEPEIGGQVHLVVSSPEGGGRTELRSRRYAQPGDTFTRYELSVFDVANRKQIKPEVDRTDFRQPTLRWNRDGYRFTYEKEDRGHQRLRLIEVDTHTAAIRNIIDEKTDTFIWTDHAAGGVIRPITYLDRTDEIIYVSEKSGWRHMYLIDAKTGKEKNAITKGEWLILAAQIDEENRQIRFSALGSKQGQDPYFHHFYRVNFDGTGLVALTDGNGHHTVAYSPDRKYLVDTYSRIDMAPVNELRRASDGKLVCKLEESDTTELKATGWKPPEIFVSKARDGKTDIWGLIHRPRDYDPTKKYPVLEDIYAGPHGSSAPHTFSGADRYAAYNRLGFVVVKLDGMGTANRSKAFHDYCWRNIKDAGFPDRILWMKAAAAKDPGLDLDRVGIYGTSAGGQNAAAALLFHPEFYKVAVANCGCHDNRIDKSSWNEQWMGYMPPEKIWVKSPDNWYSESSNIDQAHKLRGKLFLIVGELDTNVPPESTYRFVDALIKAGKDFDMLVVPGADHGAGSSITGRRTQDYFVHHLLKQEPPNRNAGDGTGATGN